MIILVKILVHLAARLMGHNATQTDSCQVIANYIHVLMAVAYGSLWLGGLLTLFQHDGLSVSASGVPSHGSPWLAANR